MTSKREPILSVRGVEKTYASGTKALDGVSLEIEAGEILALLGPNGAGKTTLISIICGLVKPTAGTISVGGHDIVRDYRAARRLIGLVPQELALEPFDNVFTAVRLSRGLFGKRRDDAYLETLLRRLSLWEKREANLNALSGGMRRRVLIAKALAHQPRVLFLDEPTAGVDVELRKDMWDVVRGLKAEGVTTILTTHYIEEAEAIADRVGIILDGKVLLVEEKRALMRRMGRRQMRIALETPVAALPDSMRRYRLELGEGGRELLYTYDEDAGPAIGPLLADLAAAGLTLADVETHQRTLEDIFVELVRRPGREAK